MPRIRHLRAPVPLRDFRRNALITEFLRDDWVAISGGAFGALYGVGEVDVSCVRDLRFERWEI